MGHIIEYSSYDEKCNRKEVLMEICEYANRNGDGYSGSVHWHDEVPPLRNYEEAMAWIEKHDRGWYDDHAVRYYSYSQAPPSKTTEDLKRRIEELYDKSKEYEKAHSVRSFKAEFIGCPNCSSKIAKKYLRSEYCPVCHTDLRSKTTLDTLANYDKKREELCDKLKNVNESRGKKTVKWLVKYEFHS